MVRLSDEEHPAPGQGFSSSFAGSGRDLLCRSVFRLTSAALVCTKSAPMYPQHARDDHDADPRNPRRCEVTAERGAARLVHDEARQRAPRQITRPPVPRDGRTRASRRPPAAPRSRAARIRERDPDRETRMPPRSGPAARRAAGRRDVDPRRPGTSPVTVPENTTAVTGGASPVVKTRPSACRAAAVPCPQRQPCYLTWVACSSPAACPSWPEIDISHITKPIPIMAAAALFGLISEIS